MSSHSTMHVRTAVTQAPACLRSAKVPCRASLQQAQHLVKCNFFGQSRQLGVQKQFVQQCRRPIVVKAEEKPVDAKIESVAQKETGSPQAGNNLTTLGFIATWYALNVGFNLQNKTIFNYFPFPWTVSAVHVVVGLAYCTVAYFLGAKNASFQRPITKSEFQTIAGPASMHAIGHVAANLSFAAVAISLTHTVKTLEPVFSVVLSKVILGQATPLPVVGTLVPIMAGVAMASAAELSFNWSGFISAMVSNLTFGFRAVWSKKAMTDIKDLSSTAIYAWTTLVSVLICVPGALIFEGPKLQAGIDAALKKEPNFYLSLLSVGLLYHLYNQFAFNTLSRVTPVSHGVCNVVKRVVIIGTSVVFFGNKLTDKTKLGTAIALLGTYLYTEATKRYKAQKPSEPASGTSFTPKTA
ncbi:Aminopeptidase 2 mitochondrial [Trebouxia sp. C0010 RCD-2024]